MVGGEEVANSAFRAPRSAPPDSGEGSAELRAVGTHELVRQPGLHRIAGLGDHVVEHQSDDRDAGVGRPDLFQEGTEGWAVGAPGTQPLHGTPRGCCRVSQSTRVLGPWLSRDSPVEDLDAAQVIRAVGSSQLPSPLLHSRRPG
jgi:hypothetical protein